MKISSLKNKLKRGFGFRVSLGAAVCGLEMVRAYGSGFEGVGTRFDNVSHGRTLIGGRT